MNNPEIDEYGTQYWYNSYHQFHRTDGPAIIYPGGSQSWYLNGQLHRIDGPAWIDSDGSQAWYVNEKQIFSNKKFQQVANLTDEEMTLIILKYGNIK